MPGSPAMSVGEGGYTIRTGRFVAIHFVGAVEAVWADLARWFHQSGQAL